MSRKPLFLVILAGGWAVGLTFSFAQAQAPAPPAPQANVEKGQLFMLLPYESKTQIAARNGSNSKTYWGTWAAYGKEMAEAGVLADGSALQLPADARTLRNRSGKPQVSSGSYSATKEQLTGFLLLRVKTMEEAERWAGECPALQNGGAVEIRPTVVQMASDRQ